MIYGIIYGAIVGIATGVGVNLLSHNTAAGWAFGIAAGFAIECLYAPWQAIVKILRSK